MSKMRWVALGTVLGATALAGPASATPSDSSLAQVFPVASRLCSAVRTGHAPAALRGQVMRVEHACAALSSAYAPVWSQAAAAEQRFRSAEQAARTEAELACQKAKPTGDKRSCLLASAQAGNTIVKLSDVVTVAAVRYHQAIEAVRRAFWSDIHGLRGGAGITPDRPAPHVLLPLTVP